jgi:hypothetical protein
MMMMMTMIIIIIIIGRAKAQSLATNCGGPGSSPAESMLGFVVDNVTLGKFFSEFFGFPLVTHYCTIAPYSSVIASTRREVALTTKHIIIPSVLSPLQS